MSFLCFSTEDIPTGPDRTLRTVGPAGTAPASSTGMWMDACVNSCIFTALFYMRAVRAQCVSQRTVVCITLSFWITSVSGSSASWLGRIVILLCVTAQLDAALWVWPLIAQTPLQVWSLHTVTRDLLRLIAHSHSHALSLSNLMRWATTQTLSRAPMCVLTFFPSLLLSSLLSLSLFYTHTCTDDTVSDTQTHTTQSYCIIIPL